MALAIALNHGSRKDDEWFDEPDELDRVENALHVIDNIDEPVEAAAVLAYRMARAQGFGEANKRTAFLLARWLLDRNGIDGVAVLPSDDRVVADLLVRAASGHDVQKEIVSLFKSRWT